MSILGDFASGFTDSVIDSKDKQDAAAQEDIKRKAEFAQRMAEMRLSSKLSQQADERASGRKVVAEGSDGQGNIVSRFANGTESSRPEFANETLDREQGVLDRFNKEEDRGIKNARLQAQTRRDNSRAAGGGSDAKAGKPIELTDSMRARLSGLTGIDPADYTPAQREKMSRWPIFMTQDEMRQADADQQEQLARSRIDFSTPGNLLDNSRLSPVK